MNTSITFKICLKCVSIKISMKNTYKQQPNNQTIIINCCHFVLKIKNQIIIYRNFIEKKNLDAINDFSKWTLDCYKWFLRIFSTEHVHVITLRVTQKLQPKIASESSHSDIKRTLDEQLEFEIIRILFHKTRRLALFITGKAAILASVL